MDVDESVFKNLRRVKLLLVEDDDDTLKWMHSILEIYFDQIYTAKDGADGLSVCQKESPDIVITDIRMVGIDGLSMIRALKKQAPALPVIITTAHSGSSFLSEIAEYENMVFLKKPIDLDEILIAANNFFKSKDPNKKYIFDKTKYSVKINDKEIALTNNECRLFEILDSKYPSIATTKEIESFVWKGFPPRNEALRMLITSLRKKITPLYVDNVKGIGYKLR